MSEITAETLNATFLSETIIVIVWWPLDPAPAAGPRGAPRPLLQSLTCGAFSSCLMAGLLVSGEAALHAAPAGSRRQRPEAPAFIRLHDRGHRALQPHRATERPRVRDRRHWWATRHRYHFSCCYSNRPCAWHCWCCWRSTLALISWGRSKSELLIKHFRRFITNNTSNTTCYANEVANYSQPLINYKLLTFQCTYLHTQH